MEKNNKTYIWIRHVEKKYNNGRPVDGGKLHDSPIVEDSQTQIEIEKLVKELVEIYGIPDNIITSPFLRTRQTSSMIKETVMRMYQRDIKIECSTDVGEFLGFCKNKNEEADLELETKKHYKEPYIIGERIKALYERLVTHIKKINRTERNVWIVTHGIIMSKIHTIFNNIEPSRPKPLDYMLYNGNKLTAFF